MATDPADSQPLKVVFLVKRFLVNKDLFDECFGRYFHLPSEMAKLGHPVKVWALDNRRRSHDRMEYSGVQFESIPLSSTNFALCMRKLGRRTVEEADILVAGGHLFLGVAGQVVARQADKPWVFDATDYFPAHPPVWLPGKAQLFRYLLRQADGMIAISDTLSSWIGEEQPKRLTLTTGVEARFLQTPSRKAACEQMNWESARPRVGYFGSLTQRTGIDDLLSAFRIARGKMPELVLVLAGRNQLNRTFDEPGVHYLGFLSVEDTPIAMAACDVLVIPYPDCLHNRYAGPCKIAEYLAVGRPVVVTRVGNYADFFSSTPQSVCTPSNPVAMADALLLQLREPQVQPFPEELTWRFMAQELSLFLKSLASPRNAARATYEPKH